MYNMLPACSLALFGLKDLGEFGPYGTTPMWNYKHPKKRYTGLYCRFFPLSSLSICPPLWHQSVWGFLWALAQRLNANFPQYKYGMLGGNAGMLCIRASQSNNKSIFHRGLLYSIGGFFLHKGLFFSIGGWFTPNLQKLWCLNAAML